VMPTSNQVIYLDNNSTTKIDPKVLEAMLPFLENLYGNAASTHSLGRTVAKHIKQSREIVADLLLCDPVELIFTSGATESINLGLTGYALQNQNRGNHIISIATEHRAVLDTLKHLESIGFEVTLLDVEKDGSIALNKLIHAFKKTTILVAAMWSNNETGFLHRINDIVEIVHQNGAIFFCDATQAVGKIPVDLRMSNIDLLSFSAHKFHGPKGVGVLFVKNVTKNRKSILPIQFGGGHENGLRSGTLNAPGIIGLAKALEICHDNLSEDIVRIKRQRDLLENELLKIPGAFVNGSIDSRIHNTSNICFPGLDANVFVERTNSVAMSNGSACAAAMVEPSHVLKALGITDEQANASIRFSLSRLNTEDEITEAMQLLKESLNGGKVKYA
jgi:cysteine desulfurase